MNYVSILVFFYFAAFLGYASASWTESLYNAVPCYLRECCEKRNANGIIDDLRNKLNSKLYGQHIVTRSILPVLEAHLTGRSRKPLVISLHGTPGTGKNYVAEQIAEAMYDKGLASQFVHKYMGRADFPIHSHVQSYKVRLADDVRRALKACQRPLFIFDEVDQIPAGVFESLTSFLNYNTYVNGVDGSGAIFLFLSNTGGVEIANKFAELLEAGVARQAVTFADFEQVIRKVAYNSQGGLQQASAIETHLIDFFLPFLPMGRDEVIQCIKAELNRWHITPTNEKIKRILDDSITYDPVYGLFAVSGCKTLEKRVLAYMDN